MSIIKEKCKIEFVSDPDTVWKLVLKGDCSKQTDLIENMPKGKKRYIKKRVELI